MQKHNTKEEEIRAITQSMYRSVQTWNEHIHVCIQKTYGHHSRGVFYTLITNSELVNAEGLLQGETWG